MLTPKTIRLIKYTLVIGGSFYLGILIVSFPFRMQKEVNTVSLKEFASRLESAAQKDLIIHAKDFKITAKRTEIQQWIEPYIRNYSGKQDKRVSIALVGKYLESLAPRFEIEPIDAKFKFQNGKAEIFIPSVQGMELNINGSANIIAAAMIENKPSASLIFDTIEPDITLEKINNLGIKTFLGRGESDYGKSPVSRIHNIKIGMLKFNGIILKPGEEFSFNKFLGEVDGQNGYQAELVIKNGQLVREYGGGLCQVSTTIFRAAILSGLTVSERKPHSFPVQYYNPQGFDSTIYPGITDLKFVNNTPNHILIQTKVIGSKLTVEIYGSDDGREVKIEGPIQYDRRTNGAMKAYFIRKIHKNGELIKEERFDSIYKAPPASPLERNPLE